MPRLLVSPGAVRSIHVTIVLLATAAAAHAEPAPGFLQNPLPRRYAERARWRGGEAAARPDGPAIASAPRDVEFDALVAVVGHVRSGKVRILHTGSRLTIAMWVDQGSLSSEIKKGTPLSMADYQPRNYGAELWLSGRALPPDTFVYEASSGEPIGFVRDWIAVMVNRSRAGWSEVTLGTELGARVWVRNDRISHLR